MCNSVYKTILTTAIAFAVFWSLFVLPDTSSAKHGDDDNRSVFYGIVQSRPENGLKGEWAIGGRTFIADERTEFDQTEGQLTVGSCAKVHVRNGRVHEIDSEPMHDCK